MRREGQSEPGAGAGLVPVPVVPVAPKDFDEEAMKELFASLDTDGNGMIDYEELVKGFRKLGRRKQWIVPAQILLGVILIALSLSNPTNEAIGWFSLLAGIGALASATQDIAINAWRIAVDDQQRVAGTNLGGIGGRQIDDSFGDDPEGECGVEG